MLISDIIARRIIEMLEQSDNGMAEIQRNTLADAIGCVPSQINYVISSRFTPEHGYLVESKRGGGGYIRITQVRNATPALLMHLVNSVGESIDSRTAVIIIDNLFHREIISASTARLMSCAISDNSLRQLPPQMRDRLRASILKQMLLALV